MGSVDDSSPKHLEELRTGSRDVPGTKRNHDVAGSYPYCHRFGQVLPLLHQGHVPMPMGANRLGKSTRIGPVNGFFARGVDLGQE
jgi:hypothetical protein